MSSLRAPKSHEKRVLRLRSVEFHEQPTKKGIHVTVSPDIFERVMMWNGVIAGDVAIKLAEPASALVMHSKVLRTSGYFEAALSWQEGRGSDHFSIDLTDRNPAHVHYLLYCLYFPKHHFEVERCPAPFWEGIKIPLGELPELKACSSYLQISVTAGVQIDANTLPVIRLPECVLDTDNMSVWLDYAGFHPEDENTLVFNASYAVVAWLNSLVGISDVFERLRVEFTRDDAPVIDMYSYKVDMGKGLVCSGECMSRISLSLVVKRFFDDDAVWPTLCRHNQK